MDSYGGVMKISGKVKLELKRGQEVVWTREGSNLVVTAGKNLIAALVAAAGSTRPSHMAIGSSSTVTTVGMTALQGTEHERVALDSTSRIDNEVTYTATFGTGIGGSLTVAECGIFNAGVAGTMLARFVTSEFTIDSGYSLAASWTLAFGD